MSIQQANIEMKIFLKKFEKRSDRLDHCGLAGTRCLVHYGLAGTRCLVHYGLVDFRKKPAQDRPPSNLFGWSEVTLNCW